MKKTKCALLILLFLLSQMLEGRQHLTSPTPQPTVIVRNDQQPGATQQNAKENVTLATLKKVGDFPFYTMRYEGDYGFKEYLQGLKQPPSLLQTRSMPLFTQTLEVLESEVQPAYACTGFTARSLQGERLLGRNFDWYRHPALLLFTDSPDGYASVSMVDISYLGFQGLIKQDDPAALSELLKSPYLPFDGMNERGLGVGMMAVTHSEGGNDPSKATLDSLGIIRVLLDYAADVDQAIELLDQYNVDWGNGPALHYLLADASGDSAVAEFIKGKIMVFRSQNPWQISTNFLFAETLMERADGGCWRYKKVDATLARANGTLSTTEAMALLDSVSQMGTTGTIWSVVYNLTNGQIQVAIDRDYQNLFLFELRR